MKLMGFTLFALLLFTACNSGDQVKVNNSESEQKEAIVKIKSELVTVLKHLPEYHLVYPYELPELAYEYNAMEPYIDAETMKTHHSKHHKGYTKKTNKAIEESNLQELPLISMFAEIDIYDKGVRNNGGGYYNHRLYWTFMSPEGTKFEGEVAEAIRSQFKSYEAFQEEFENAAATQFGSGWAWLVLTMDGELKVTQTANQNNPLMLDQEIQGIPLLNLDVWEHAYYLAYQNRRKEYISNFWNIVNWEIVNERFKMAKKVISK